MRNLTADGVQVNVTALLSLAQVAEVVECLGDAPAYVSVFAGRIADTAGLDPVAVDSSGRVFD